MSGRSWQPERPERPAAAWEARAGSPAAPASAAERLRDRYARTDADADARADVRFDAVASDEADGVEPAGAGRRAQPPPLQAAGRRAGRALRRVWTRASRGRRLGLTVGAVAVVTALVAGAGLAMQPRYDEPVRPAMLVDDLRGEPTTTVWQTDLAGASTPGTPKNCVAWGRIGMVGDDALLAAQSTELSDRCGGAGGRLARVDGETGALVWNANVATALGRAVRGLSVTVDADGRAATLVVDDAPGSTLARIDLRTGDVTDGSPSVESNDPSQVSRVEGVSATTVLVSHQPRDRFGADGMGATTVEGDRTLFELRPLRDLDTVIWRSDVLSQATVSLVDDQLFVLTTLGDGPRVVDAATGDEHRLPVDSDVYGWPQAGHDHVFVSFVTPTGQHLVAFSRDDPGVEDWSIDLPAEATTTVSDRCLVVTTTVESGDPIVSGPRGSDRPDDDDEGGAEGDRGRESVTCVSPSTGETVWETTVPVPSGQTAQAGWGPAPEPPFDELQVTVSPTSSFGDETTTTTTFDTADGHVVSRTTAPGFSIPVAWGRTTVYLLSYGVDARVAMVAADRDSRRELWRISRNDAVSFEFWGAHLVMTTQDGVIRRLGDRTAVVDGS
ncbi:MULTISPECIES: PQQ-binding-like beta-propeller repeat protein [unclassified Frigoribacterium]|uniref:outer membrane protein assembly factor BamB family protein n=1 Tax=unclassified Frigoribacterium TaxID=2627005 RepID=UPI0006FDF0BF|nr:MULTISPECIES: PQQ-binding-like beta-propeller repeat protein [unclassified Frigoribacterium]KQO48019.1 hypothetical protein ASF07_11610 [Frigoribacterium sp. Leaf254]KQT40113.1 hypothetical protein ASG28_11620 [Frigoribacterium sp. Leaf415]